MQMSNYLENALINGTLRNTQYTVPTTVYLALYTNDPTDADIGTEVTGSSYARQVITFNAPTNGTSTNSNDVTFPIATGSYGTVTHIGIRDALTNGNLLYHAPLVTARTIVLDNQFIIKAGQLSVTLA